MFHPQAQNAPEKLQREISRADAVTADLASAVLDLVLDLRGLTFMDSQGLRLVLRLDAAAANALPAPEHAAPVFNEDPERQQPWRHWVHLITGRGDWNRQS